MMPHIDLLKHRPEKHRPLTEHERTAIAVERAERTKTLDTFYRLLGGLGRLTQALDRPAKVR